ncbi:MAG: arsenate reductase ArsC [Betaproteobacteria bacterium]|nr:arsenate reductase ArsC [Betaproteobacteria bacterium]
MADRVYNTLFLCTGNSARSVMAEALLSTLGKGRFRAFSAGSQPTGKVNPFAIEKTEALGYAREHLRSKSWDEYAVAGAPQMDIIITVCDNAAGEACPIWPGHPATAHWGFPDPAAAEGSDDDKRHAFDLVFHAIRRRVELLVNLPPDKLERLALPNELKRIARETA